MDVPVKPNEPVKAGTVLFRIDPAPFQYKVQNLEASLAQAKQQVKQLKVAYEQASANVQGLTKETAYLDPAARRHDQTHDRASDVPFQATGHSGSV